jgi:DNA-binding transcriptional MocR family regulator
MRAAPSTPMRRGTSGGSYARSGRGATTARAGTTGLHGFTDEVAFIREIRGSGRASVRRRHRVPNDGGAGYARRLWRGSTSSDRGARDGRYTPGEQPQGGGFIKLNTNENPYPPSARVRDAIAACATEDVRLYPDPMANALRDAAARRYDDPRDCIVAGNGSDDLLAIVMRACIDAGDTVAYPYPTYSLYDTLAEIAGARVVRLPWPADFTLARQLAARTRG